MIWPVGVLIRKTSGTDPIYEWGENSLITREGWRKKNIPSEVSLISNGETTSSGQIGVWSVLKFFIQVKQFLLLPVLLILVTLGIVLFFLQTSALAPFIYTIF
ncbi:DUF5989 family protein [Gammaproteobacteria bacterium]|nr:DUF5989 family protein [Gammaproteobacteria bacterium]